MTKSTASEEPKRKHKKSKEKHKSTKKKKDKSIENNDNEETQELSPQSEDCSSDQSSNPVLSDSCQEVPLSSLIILDNSSISNKKSTSLAKKKRNSDVSESEGTRRSKAAKTGSSNSLDEIISPELIKNPFIFAGTGAPLRKIEEETGRVCKRGKLSAEEEDILRRGVDDFFARKNLPIEAIGRYVERKLKGSPRTPAECATKEEKREFKLFIGSLFTDRNFLSLEQRMRRWYLDLKCGPWSEEERDTLARLVSTHGHQWSLIASQLNRHPQDVTSYWNRYKVILERRENNMEPVEKSYRWLVADKALLVQLCLGKKSVKSKISMRKLAKKLDKKYDWLTLIEKYNRKAIQKRSADDIRLRWTRSISVTARRVVESRDKKDKMKISELVELIFKYGSHIFYPFSLEDDEEMLDRIAELYPNARTINDISWQQVILTSRRLLTRSAKNLKIRFRRILSHFSEHDADIQFHTKAPSESSTEFVKLHEIIPKIKHLLHSKPSSTLHRTSNPDKIIQPLIRKNVSFFTVGDSDDESDSATNQHPSEG